MDLDLIGVTESSISAIQPMRPRSGGRAPKEPPVIPSAHTETSDVKVVVVFKLGAPVATYHRQVGPEGRLGSTGRDAEVDEAVGANNEPGP
jgi:hypothetical protein